MLIAFNKPCGVLSRFTPDGSPSRALAEFGLPGRVYPIGRLDADSEGLLLLSDEGALNEQLLQPRHAHEREYWAQVERIPAQDSLRRLEQAVQEHPTNLQAAFDLAAACLEYQQTNRAVEVLDRVFNRPDINHPALDVLAQAYAQIQDLTRLRAVLDKAAKLFPDSPEAWYNLAGLQAMTGNSTEAPANLRRALELSAARLKLNPGTPDLAEQARKDPRLAPILQRPDFRQWRTPAQQVDKVNR